MQASGFKVLLRCASFLLLAPLLSFATSAQTLASASAGPAVFTPAEGTPATLAAESSSSSSSADLPDAPQVSSSQDPNLQPKSETPAQGGQTKRILGVIPNFRSVSADVKLPPQSVREKFVTATQDSFDYSTILLPGLLAGYSQATNATPEFRQGAAGYARYFWHSYVDQTSENYLVEAIIPAITRQDSRYYTMGRGGFLKRTEYSLSRVLITRTDAGKETFNTSEIVGAGAAAGISNFYYPSRERTFGNTASKWGQSVGVDAFTFMAKEFWPDINQHLFHGHSSF